VRLEMEGAGEVIALTVDTDELNGRADHVCIRCGTMLGAMV
jgi:hypothetical protein